MGTKYRAVIGPSNSSLAANGLNLKTSAENDEIPRGNAPVSAAVPDIDVIFRVCLPTVSCAQNETILVSVTVVFLLETPRFAGHVDFRGNDT